MYVSLRETPDAFGPSLRMFIDMFHSYYDLIGLLTVHSKCLDLYILCIRLSYEDYETSQVSAPHLKPSPHFKRRRFLTVQAITYSLCWLRHI